MNKLESAKIEISECPAVTDASVISERFQEYLGDESRICSETVGAIYIPETSAQVAGCLQKLSSENKSCVLSAGRTGITGAIAPLDADAVVTLEKMNKLLALGKDGDTWYVRAEPGISLAEIAELLDKKNVSELTGATEDEKSTAQEYMNDDMLALWFPVDPTEMTAHLGGVVANNASGARTYKYGATRPWVLGIEMILASGKVIKLERGQVNADGFVFELDGERCAVSDIKMPPTKCTAGFFMKENMDLIDLLIGSEGTLGAMTEIKLKLTQKPEAILGVLAVVEDEEKALKLVRDARESNDVNFEALEYFDNDALKLLKAKKDADGAGSHIPDIPSWDGAAVYLEIGGTENETEEACMTLEELLSEVDSSIDDTWAAMEPSEMEDIKLFRHSVPEAVNAIIGQRAAQHPGLHKVGTDMAVPNAALEEMMSVYRRGLADAGLESVVFGHIGDNHVHVNILPKDLDDLKKAKELYLEWAKEAVRLGGTVAAEHGIGRIKKSMLEIQYEEHVLDRMREIRKVFDPTATLAPGVLV